MIDHNNHFDRYNTLMSLVSAGFPARRKDGGYMAALYILSADKDLYHLARPYARAEGIDFKRLLTAARRAEVLDSQLTAIRAAHSLFNDGSTSVAPADLSRCDYATLDIITQALYIRKGGRVPTKGETGQMCLDDAAEQRARCFEAAFAAM